MSFVLTQLRVMKWRPEDKKTSRVLSWYDARGSRWFNIRVRRANIRNNHRYDIRVIVGQEAVADRENISIKAVIIAARTIGILLTEEQVEKLMQVPQPR